MRKFTCPFCGYVHIFTPTGKERYPKKVKGFTCPRCGKKSTEKDFKKRLNKSKKRPRKQNKDVLARSKPDKPKMSPPQSDTAPIEWRTSVPSYAPPSMAGHPAARVVGGNYKYGQRQPVNPKPLQPTDRSLGEAVMGSLNIKPSAPIKGLDQKVSVGLSREDRESIEKLIEALEKNGRKLAAMIATMSNIEERVDSKTRELDSKLQALSALLSRMEDIISYHERLAKGRR